MVQYNGHTIHGEGSDFYSTNTETNFSSIMKCTRDGGGHQMEFPNDLTGNWISEWPCPSGRLLPRSQHPSGCVLSASQRMTYGIFHRFDNCWTITSRVLRGPYPWPTIAEDGRRQDMCPTVARANF